MAPSQETAHDIGVEDMYFWIAVSICGVYCLTIIFYIVKLRNKQPLRKKSPLLIIASVIGNFSVIFNSTLSSTWFTKVLTD